MRDHQEKVSAAPGSMRHRAAKAVAVSTQWRFFSGVRTMRGEAALILTKKAQLRFFRSGVGMLPRRPFSRAARFERLEMTPQFGTVLSDLVASFATIE